MADPRLRQLTIKTGVVKRLTKEKTVYEREVVQQKQRIERLRAEGKDDYVLRKVSHQSAMQEFFRHSVASPRLYYWESHFSLPQEDEVLTESQMMVPDCVRRLAKAYEELSEFLKNEQELKETKEFEAAQTALDAAQPELQQKE